MPTMTLDGTKYDLPTFDKITLGEWKTVKRHSGMNMAQIEEMGDSAGSDPGILAGLIHVGVSRAKPELSFDEVARRIDLLTMEEIAEGLQGDDEAEQSPPGESSPSESEPSSPTTGSDGEGDGEQSLETPTPPDTGQPDSDTGPDSDPATSTGLHAISLKAAASS